MARRNRWAASSGSVTTKQVKEFQSWSELLEYTKPEPKPLGGHPTYSRGGFGASWSGTSTFAEAVEIAENGWAEGENKARKFSNLLFDRVASLVERETVVYDVEGLEIDMGAYTRGEPECWMRFEKHLEEDEGSDIVRIVVNGGASAAVSAETIIARGAVIAALVELLEFSGKRAEVVHYLTFEHFIHFKTLLKAADQPLDLSRLMFAVAHPAMLRRIMFSALEQNPKEHAEIGSGYGVPRDVPEGEKGDVYLSTMYSDDPQWTDPKRAEQWLIGELQAQGITVNLDKK